MRRFKVKCKELLTIPSGEIMKQIKEAGYKCLVVLEIDNLLEKEMTDKFKAR